MFSSSFLNNASVQFLFDLLLLRIKPILVKKLLKNLDPGVVIDATFGSGGHSSEILNVYSNFNIIGIDRDLDSIDSSKSALEYLSTTLPIFFESLAN